MSTRLDDLLGHLGSPILQAPMAGGPSTPKLAAAVHRAGAFGQLAGANLSAEALTRQLDEVDQLLEHERSEAGLLPVGVNLFVPDPDTADPAALESYRKALELVAVDLGAEVPEVPEWSDDDFAAKLSVLAERPPVVLSFTFGLPKAEVIQSFQARGTAVLLSVASVPDALQAAALSPDGLIVQGQQAGGHRAVLSMHDEPEPVDTVALLHAVQEALASAEEIPESEISLIAAGGVGTADDVAALLRAGAGAVQVGTQFLTAAEAGTKAAHRQATLDPRRRETVLTRTFSGRPARGLRNRFIDEMSVHAVVGYPQVNQMTGPLRAAAHAAGDDEHLSLWAGTRTDQCREETAADVVARLTP